MKRLILLGISLLLILIPASAQEAPTPTTDFSTLDTHIEEALKAQNTPGIAVLVFQAGEVIYSKGFGVRNTETNDPVTSDTLFMIGSITKPFTSIALLQLAEQGLVDLSAPVTRYLPDFQAGDDITLQHLLSHSAGLHDDAQPYGPPDPVALKASIATFGPEAVLTRAGQVQSYSNPGYNIAGAVIEAATGQYYAEYMQNEVFPMMGMQRTTFDPRIAITYPVAVGYQPGLIGLGPVRPLSDNVAEYPSGFMYASVNDLANLIAFILQDGRVDDQAVLSAESAVLMKTTVSVPIKSSMQYGLGLIIDTYRGTPVIGHGGQIDGYSAYLNTLPDYDLGVVVLANNIAFDADPIFDAVVDATIGLPAPEAVATEVFEVENLEAYAGTYELKNIRGEVTFTIQIEALEDSLMARVTGQLPLTLRPAGPDVFDIYLGANPVGGQFNFLRDESGAIAYFSAGYRVGARVSP